MKIRNVYNHTLVIFAVFLTACVPSASLEIETELPQGASITDSAPSISTAIARTAANTRNPTEQPTLTETSSPTVIPSTWTPFPIIPTEKYQEYVSSLLENNRGCELPCLWGITPGETTWKEAKKFLDTFATTGWSPEFNAGFALVPPPYDIEYIDKLGYEYYVSDGLIKNISTVNHYFPQIQAWYFLPEILQEYGQPDQVGIYTDGKNRAGIRHSGLILFYSEFGAIIEYPSFREVKASGDDIRMCPTGLGNYMNTWAPVLDLTYEDAVERFVDNVEQGLPMPRPLQEVSDMDPQTFYEVFKEPDNKPCLTTHLEYWPNFNK